MRNSSSLDWLRFMHTPNDYRVSHFNLIPQGFRLSRKTLGLSLKPWGIALKFLFLHHENILFPND